MKKNILESHYLMPHTLADDALKRDACTSSKHWCSEFRATVSLKFFFAFIFFTACGDEDNKIGTLYWAISMQKNILESGRPFLI